MVSVILSLMLFFFNILNPAPRPSAKAGVARLSEPVARHRLLAAYAQLPLSFEANHGQTDARVKFLARSQGYTLFLTSQEAVLKLQKPGEPAEIQYSKFDSRMDLTRQSAVLGSQSSVVSGQLKRPTKTGQRTTDNGPRTTDNVLRMNLVGANSSAPVAGLDQLPGVSNYFTGNDPAQWRTNIKTYRKVRYNNIYSGVDLVYYGTQGRLEYDFIVAPGANPASVLLNLKGGTCSVNKAGDLVIKMSGGEMVFRKPYAYQMEDGRTSATHIVSAEYVLKAPNRVAVRVGNYDASKTLVIDPVLSYGTYLGGNQGDTAFGIALDSSGDAYVTGTTASPNFPATSGFQTANKGVGDAFVTKLNPTGTALLYSTFLGGSKDDRGKGIAVDSTGNAYVVGTTLSTDFPTAPTATTGANPTPGAFQTANNGSSVAFVAKLGPTGATLVYSTYLGGSGGDFGFAIAIDKSGNTYVTGSTSSTDFPLLNPFQAGNDGQGDAFVTEVNPTGTALVYSTFLGGANADSGQGIAVDSGGNAYVTGYTYSTNFPLAAPLQPTLGGSADVFVTKVIAGGTSLVYSTFLGGSGLDRGAAIALDATGNVYVTGDTQSNDFPTVAGGLQHLNSGNDDAFVAKLDSAGATLVYSTFLGGSGLDQGTAIAVDTSSNAYVTGFTKSPDFPMSNPVQATFSGGACGPSSNPFPCEAAFVAQLNPQGTALLYSTYLGGNGMDSGQAIAVDTTGNAYVAGGASSANFPVVAGAYQGAPGDTAGNGDAFVVKIAPTNAAGVSITPQTLNFGNQVTNTQSGIQTIRLTNVGTMPLNVTAITGTADFGETNNCVGTIAPSGGFCTISISYTPTTLQTVTEQILIADDAAGSPQHITATGTGVNPTTTVQLSPSSLSFANQSVNTSSQSQTVTITNTGSTPLTITNIAASGDFAQTNNCPTTPLQSNTFCSIFITFTPTTTGARSGTVTIKDNGANNPQAVALTGTGIAGYSLSVPVPSAILLIGSTSTTFTLSAVGPPTITGNIALTCEAGPTCSFNPANITIGQTSTLTITGIPSPTTAAPQPPLNFVVDGTSANQTARLPLTLFFKDYTVAATPALNTIAAGASATYTVTLTGTNGFNQAVLLSCATLGMPADASCVFSPSAVSLNGVTNSTATLTVTTTARSETQPGLWSQRPSPPGLLPRILLGVLCCFLVILAARRVADFSRPVSSGVRGARPVPLNAMATLMAFLLLAAAASSGCNTNFYQTIFPGTVKGTQPGPYTIIIKGTLTGSTTQVTRGATVNLAVS